MIKYDSHATASGGLVRYAPIENMVFLDFQYSCFTSPAIDLHYFFNMSLEESLRPNRFDELIEVYHTHLETYLKRFEYKRPIPTLDQFKQQYLDRMFFGTNIERIAC